MNKEHDKLFADLDALTEEQIEVGLAAGVWNEQVRPLVQHYLCDLKLTRVEAAADQLDEMQKATQLAVEKLSRLRRERLQPSLSREVRYWQRWQQP
jgi:hypothetical protein